VPEPGLLAPIAASVKSAMDVARWRAKLVEYLGPELAAHVPADMHPADKVSEAAAPALPTAAPLNDYAPND
jgi:hypothetical protein